MLGAGGFTFGCVVDMTGGVLSDVSVAGFQTRVAVIFHLRKKRKHLGIAVLFK